MKKETYNWSFQPTKLVIHSLFWLLAIHLLFDISGLYYSLLELFWREEWYFDEALILIPLLLGLFYVNLLYLIPRYLNRKGWWQYLTLLLLAYFISLYIGYGCLYMLDSMDWQLNGPPDEFWDIHLIFNLTIIGISTSLGLYERNIQKSEQQRIAEEKQKAAELKYLRAQFHPHFLFNTLNGIYALAVTEEALATEEAILKLSEIMRYPLQEGNEKRVELGKEIAFIKDYIDLQRIRLGADYPILLDTNYTEQQTQIIAPLLFISFVENAFKYGVSQNPPQPIKISIRVQENILYFYVENYLAKITNAASFEIGLANVKSRLELLYPSQYQLKIERKEQLFKIYLQINLGY